MAKLELFNYLLLSELRGYEERKQIGEIDGRIISLHTGKENDRHHTPHFHVNYAGKSGAYKIEDGSKLEGNLSIIDDKKIRKCYEQYLDILISSWNEYYPEMPLKIKEKV